MKIGVISDTHGCAATWEYVQAKFFHDVDFMIHAGDVLYHGPRNAIPEEYNPAKLAERINASPIPVIVACGNCDAEVDGMVLDVPVQSPYAYVVVDGKRILVHHGHSLSDDAQQAMAVRYQAAVMITGHTHVAKLEKRNGILFLNPGSPAMSKRPDGKGTIAMIGDHAVEVLDIATRAVLLSETF